MSKLPELEMPRNCQLPPENNHGWLFEVDIAAKFLSAVLAQA